MPQSTTSSADFSFTDAVAAARRDYPGETRQVTFIDLSSPEAPLQLRDWLCAASPSFIRSLGDGDEAPQTSIFRAVEKFLLKNGAVEVDYASGHILVAAASKPKSKYLGAEATRAQEAAYVFAHELGHAVARNGFTHNWRGLTRLGKPSLHDALPHERAEAEMAADVFAVLRGFALQTMTVGHAREISRRRALRPPGVHTTSPAIDAAIANTGAAALSPGAVQAMAERISRRHAPKPGELEELAGRLKWLEAVRHEPESGHNIAPRLRGIFDKISHRAPRTARMPEGPIRLRRLTEAEWLNNVADVFNTARKGSLAAQVTGKILSATPPEQLTGKAALRACRKLARQNRKRG